MQQPHTLEPGEVSAIDQQDGRSPLRQLSRHQRPPGPCADDDSVPDLVGGLLQGQSGVDHAGRLQFSNQRHGQRRLTLAPCKPACSASANASTGVKAALTERGPSV